MRENYKELEAGIVIGSTVTCQLGNPGDAHGCRKHVEVEVLAERESFGQRVFLVRPVGEELLAAALVYPPRETAGLLYSTNARSYGKQAQTWTGVTTEAQARKSLGF